MLAVAVEGTESSIPTLLEDACIEVLQEDACCSVVSAIYAAPISCEAGSNLGVCFNRALLEEVQVTIGDKVFNIAQSGMGCLGIAGCVWNCAYYTIDYLSHLFETNFDFGDTVCDLATGTGIVGMAYAILNKMNRNVNTHITFTDRTLTSTFFDNIDCMRSEACLDPQSKLTFKSIEYDWLDSDMPPDLLRHFTTIFCSDVIYEPLVSGALLGLMKRLSFDRMVLTYKRRNDSKERFFFETLIFSFDICLAVPPITEDDALCGITATDIAFPLVNIRQGEVVAMYIIVITPKKKVAFGDKLQC